MALEQVSIETPSSSPPLQQPANAIFAALMLVLTLAALDQTIMSTALPTIVGEFGGLAYFSWLVTAYLLATTIVAPLYGKLGDLFGRKIILQSAITIFLAGSALCGLSRSMGELIAFRAIQGLGGGGLMVTTLAVIADVIPPRERGRYQGVLGAVFGLSTIVGPLIGGVFVEHLNWRWIFYINLPLGLVALGVIGRAFRAPARNRRPVIDFGGAALLATLLTSVTLLTTLGGHAFSWGSMVSLVLAGIAAAALGGFVVVEHRVSEPLLPLELFKNQTFAVSCAVGFIAGLAMFGSVTFMPLYFQVAKGISPTAAGFQLMPSTGGLLVSAIISGHIISRTGRYRFFPIVGTAMVAVGLGLLSTLDQTTNPLIASGYLLLLGLGMGMVNQVLVFAVQNDVDYRHLGSATSGVSLFRSTGGSVGVSLFGAIFSATLMAGLASHFPAQQRLPPTTSPATIHALPPALRTIYLEVFTASLHPVFLLASLLATAAFALAWRLKEVPLPHAKEEHYG